MTNSGELSQLFIKKYDLTSFILCILLFVCKIQSTFINLSDLLSQQINKINQIRLEQIV